jgi:hypothetical protein
MLHYGDTIAGPVNHICAAHAEKRIEGNFNCARLGKEDL